MFEEKDYTCRCHVCGVLFVVRSTFLSSPASDHEGHPMMACPEHRGKREVALAYWHNDSPYFASRGVEPRYDDVFDCVCHRAVRA